MRRNASVVALCALLVSGCTDNPPLNPTGPVAQWSASASAGAGFLLEPTTVTRGAGAPKVQNISFTVEGSVHEAVLRLVNGGAGGRDRVSAAVVTLNGVAVVEPSSLSQKVAQILVPVPLASPEVVIGVELRGSPDAYVVLSLERGAPVGPEGGDIALEGGAVQLRVPAGAVSDVTVLSAEPASPIEAPAAGMLGSTYDFGPDGSQFAKPLQITLQMPALPVGVDPSWLGLFWERPDGSWAPLEKRSVDVANGTVSGEIDHFTVIGVGVQEVTVCPGQPGAAADLAEALPLVTENGTVWLCEGVHTPNEARVERPVSILALPGSRPRIHPSGAAAIDIQGVRNGNVTIRGLDFENYTGIGIAIGGLYELVTIEDSSFDNSMSPWYGVLVTASQGPSGRAVLRGIRATRGGTGIMVANSAVMDVFDSYFTLQSWSGIQYQTGASGTVQGNTVEECGYQGCIRAIFVDQVDIVDNVVRTTSRAGKLRYPVQFGIFASGKRVQVTGNTVEGLGFAGDPAQVSSYGIQDVGIFAMSHSMSPDPVHVIASGNTVTGTARGIYATVLPGSSVPVRLEGMDNHVSQAQVATGSRGGAKLALHRNDFSDYQWAISVLDAPADSQPIAGGDLTCNWWGTESGPQGIVGPGAGTVDASAYTPFASVPIAKTRVACP